jgi:hypothetical protein
MLNDVIEKNIIIMNELIKSKLKKNFKRNINWNGWSLQWHDATVGASFL